MLLTRRRVIPLLFLLVAVFALAMPAHAAEKAPVDPQGGIYVQDEAKVLSSATKRHVRDANGRMENGRLHAQLLVVTLRSLDGESIEDKAHDLFNKYGVGGTGADGQDSNGLLYLVAVKDHKHRLEVGYGLEDDIPDNKAKELLDNVAKPSLKQGDYDEAVTKVTDRLADWTKAGKLDVNADTSDRVVSTLVSLAFAIVLIIVFTRMPSRGAYAGPVVLSSGPRYSGGGFSSSGSSGSSSFGGGRSGGGGASGSW